VSLEELSGCDVVFICAAISAIPAVAQELAGIIKPGTLVMDTCSVKEFPLQTLNNYLTPGVSIIGTHPMFGPDSADSSLHDLPMVVTPCRASEEDLQGWRSRFAGLGMRVISMTPEQHDREAARTQGITHFIGRFLASLELTPSPIGTLGFKKIFEVMEQTCNDPWQLFLDLQRYNPHTKEIRDQMTQKFDEIMGILSRLTDETPE
jgi:prephenate dehydrogenase